MGLLVLGLILFILLIIVHEYGHFLVAKRNGVDVEEFGIGFPPKLVGKKMGRGIFESYYTINLLPLGGFVKLKGENDADKRKGAFGAATTKVKLKIMLAGVAMNLLAALAIFTILAWVGMPQLVPDQFTVESDSTAVRQDVFAAIVSPGSPAEQAGIQDGNTIVSINSAPVTTSKELSTLTSTNAGQTVDIIYVNDGNNANTQATLLTTTEVEESKETDSPKGYLGVVPTEYTLLRSTWSAPVVAVGLTAQFTGLTLEALGKAVLFLGKAVISLVTFDTTSAKQNLSSSSKDLAGPLAIFKIFQNGADIGYQFILFIIGVISLSLAIMNFLPIPALDGGRAFVMLLFKGLKKPLTPELEDRIHGTGFVVLLAFIVLISIVDFNRFY